MSNFSSLKAAIQQYIKTNGNEEITGAVLQDILLSIVSVLGDTAINDLETALQTETTNRTNADGTLQQNINNEATARGNADTALGNRLTAVEGAITTINTMLGEGYVYAGIATTSTNPGTPTGKVFYIATAAGTYTNFSGIELTQGINILKYNGSVWTLEQVLAIDDVPTAGSNNLVKSGGAEKSVRILSSEIDGYEELIPVEVNEGYFCISSGLRANPYFIAKKYNVTPYETYNISGYFDEATDIYIIQIFDSEGNNIGAAGHGPSITWKNNKWIAPANAAYVYYNYSIPYSTAFSFQGTINHRNIEAERSLSLKKCGIYLVDSYKNKFMIRSGMRGNTNFTTFMFKVSEYQKIRITNKFYPDTGIDMVYFFDFCGNPMGESGITGSDVEVSVTDALVSVPQNSAYAYFNVDKRELNNAKFEIINLENVSACIIEPIINKLTPYEVVDNKFRIWSEERSNDNFQIWRFNASPNKRYRLSGEYYDAGISFGYIINSGGSSISIVGPIGVENAYKVVDGFEFVTPEGTSKIYISVNKPYIDSFALEEVGSDTDRTIEIQAALNKYGHVKLTEGVYVINGLEMPNSSVLEGVGDSTILKLDGSSDGYAVRLGKFCNLRNATLLGSWGALSLTTPADPETISIGNRHGVLLLGTGDNTAYEGTKVSGLTIKGFTGGGITCENTGYDNNGMIASDCLIKNCGVGINITYWSEFSRFTNIKAYYCKYGLINNGGNNNFVNCDFSQNGIGVFFNGDTDKAVLHDGTASMAINTAHGIMSGCTINHSGLGQDMNTGYAIAYRNTGGGFLFTGLQIHFGKLRFNVASNIQMQNIRFGNNAEIHATNGLLVVVSNITFGNNFKFKVYTNAEMTILDTAYLSDGNLQKVKLLNSYYQNGNIATIQSLNS